MTEQDILTRIAGGYYTTTGTFPSQLNFPDLDDYADAVIKWKELSQSLNAEFYDSACEVLGLSNLDNPMRQRIIEEGRKRESEGLLDVFQTMKRLAEIASFSPASTGVTTTNVVNTVADADLLAQLDKVNKENEVLRGLLYDLQAAYTSSNNKYERGEIWKKVEHALGQDTVKAGKPTPVQTEIPNTYGQHTISIGG